MPNAKSRGNALYFFPRSLERRDLRRAALFLWMMCVFAALSRSLVANESAFTVGCLRTDLTDSRRRRRTRELRMPVLRSRRSFFAACLVMGMKPSIPHSSLAGQGAKSYNKWDETGVLATSYTETIIHRVCCACVGFDGFGLPFFGAYS